MEKHINVVAALQIGLSIFNLLIAFLLFTVLKLVGGFVDDANATTILSIIADALAVMFIVISHPRNFGRDGALQEKGMGPDSDVSFISYRDIQLPFRNGNWYLFYLGAGSTRNNCRV